jgi:CheY-like chemotaxis protein
VRKGLKILIVDDETVLREAMRQLLEHCGCEVESFGDGQAALARLAQRRFELVITDFSMPGMQGDQLAARARELAPDQRIIMVTAYAHEFKVFGQSSTPVDGLLYKPFTFKELKDVIEAVLAGDVPGEMPAMASLADEVSKPQPKTLPPPKL